MNKEQLLKKLLKCSECDDHEIGHYNADFALLEYINDKEITTAFRNLIRWYA